MPSFTYRAMSADGGPVQGVLTAENYQVALRQLEEQALIPVKVEEGLQADKLPLSGGKIKTHHLTTYYSQMADLLKAGVPMLRALDVLGRQSGQGKLPQVVKEVREDVAGGMSLGDAMTKHPNAFSPLHASMVRAGEQGGFLEEVLERIAIFTEKQDELQNKLIGSMIYPAILITVGTGVVLMLMLVVVPKLREHLRPETLNIMSHVVFGITDFLKAYYLPVFGGLIVGFIALRLFAKTEYGREMLARIQLKAPILGKVMTMTAICRFCRILGTLLHNGVPILQALKISKDSAGNAILAEVIDKSGENVRKGASLSQPLGESGLFPPAVVDMISVAEESNNLESVLVQIAETNERRTARQIDLGVRIIEPILLALMAGIVLCIAIAVLLPILTMGSGVQ
jgi:type II secretory pathway component PulF